MRHTNKLPLLCWGMNGMPCFTSISGGTVPWLKEWYKQVYRHVTADMLVALGDPPPAFPAGCPEAALCCYWSAGSSPAPWVPCPPPSSSSVRGYAPPCWAQSITQRPHCNCDLRWQLMLCANQPSWAASTEWLNAVSWQPTHRRHIPASYRSQPRQPAHLSP